MHCILATHAKPDKTIKDSENTESIYRIIKSAPPPEKKEKRYVSKYKGMVVREYYDKIGPNRTMGYEKVSLPTPQNFLKKHSKEPVLPPKKPFKYPNSHKNKLPISLDPVPVNKSPVKNFIVENARNAIRMIPPNSVPKQVDNRYGDKMELEPAGLLPKYCRKKEYGLVPKYLIKRNYDMLVSKEMMNRYVTEEYQKHELPKITEEEKETLIKGLRDNWKKLNSNYLTMSLVTDSLRKIRYKEELERRLGQLERDINLISRFDNIYIAPPENNHTNFER